MIIAGLESATLDFVEIDPSIRPRLEAKAKHAQQSIMWTNCETSESLVEEYRAFLRSLIFRAKEFPDLPA